MFKAVIFDYFDVIQTDVYKAWLDKHGYKREGIFLELVNKMDHGQISLDSFLDGLSKESGQESEAIFSEMKNAAKVDYSVLDIISHLRKHYKTALLSNAPSDFLRNLIGENDIEKYFDEIIISSEVGMIKPHPDIFKLTLERLGLSPEDALFIDDNQNNIIGSEAFGIKSIKYENSSKLIEDLIELKIQL